MATTSHDGGTTDTFTIDTREHGFPDGPGYVHVELNGHPEGGMAILAAGATGRYSFDFTIDATGIDLTKAYVEGMREPVDDLPAWVTPIRERIEIEVGVATA